MEVRLTLTAGSHIIGPDMSETVRRSYYETRLVGVIEYPLYVLEASPGTGTMDIIIDLEPSPPGSDPDPSTPFDEPPFDVEDYE